MTETKTCRCRAAQLVLREIRFYPARDGGEQPKWIYGCPACPAEAVAMRFSVGDAPLFSWLAPADEDDSELGGRLATPAEAAALGDVLADSTARDHNGQRVTWQ